MDKNMLPKGVWPVMLTPFQEDGDIDWAAYDELIKFYISGGAAGLFATCLSGEIPKLAKDECVMLAERTVQAVNGQVSVVAGAICYDSLDESVAYAKRIGDTGVDAVVFAVNQFAKPDEDDACLAENLFSFAEKLGPSMRFGLYECPYPYHRKMSPELVEKVITIKQMVFLKDTTANLHIFEKKIKVTEGSSLQIYNANAPTLEASLKLGGSGYAGIGSNFFCEPFVQICNGLPDDKRGGQIRELVLAVQRYAGKAEYPAAAKYFLQKYGLKISEKCRVASTVSLEDRVELDELWETWMHVRELIK
jgi:4-hydroxy-tetrahydrodipicolinate synthase